MSDLDFSVSTPIMIPALLNINISNLHKDEKEAIIKSYSIEAHVKGAFARIKTEFEIINNNSRTFEGELEFPLPDGGVVCGYAIDIEGVMTEAAVVEKEKARIAFENEVKKGIDPGLVEQIRGNAYRTRIYPLPAHGSRRVRLDYVVPLAFGPHNDAALALPMPSTKLVSRDIVITVDIPGSEAPRLGGLGDKRFAQAERVWRVESHEQNVQGDDHLLIGMPALPEVFAAAETFEGDTFFVASANIEPQTEKTEPAIPTRWRLIWDASGSRAARDIEKSLAVVDCLPETASYELVVFRNKLDATKSFTKRSELVSALKATVYDGGTDYAPLCALDTFDGATLFFSDGFDTFTRALPDFGMNVAAITTGVSRDLAVLRRICRGHVIDLNTVSPKEAYAQILSPAPVISAIEGEGLTSIQGIGLDAIGRVTVLGRVKSDCNAKIVLSDGRSIPFSLALSHIQTGNTLASAWAARRIDELSPNPDDNREELHALGRRFSIVGPVSSLIVFERLDQWLQYDIEPPKSNARLHDEWLRNRKNRDKQKARKLSNWNIELNALWDARLKWYDHPIPQPKTPQSGLFNDNMDDDVRYFSDEDDADCVVMDGAMPYSSMEPTEEDAAPSAAMGGGHPCFASAARGGSGTSCARIVSHCAVRPNDVDSCQDRASREPQTSGAQASISIQAWSPDTPYINAIKDAYLVFHDDDALYQEYLKQRKDYASCPSFFLDCAGLFFKENKPSLAIRILSNLAELRLDDIALIRVYAWRLREAGELDDAITLLRKAAKLRPDEAVSWRDLALTLTMRAKKTHSAKDAEEALQYFKKAAFEPYDRDDAQFTAIVALEEFNALATWCEKQTWTDKAPVIPSIDPKFRKTFELDLRIVLMWDADNTDIDLHVMDPNGEEIYYGNRFSQSGAMLSNDVTSGYGPEEYLHKKAPSGTYKILSNYFASHQQKLVGPATVTATVFTNWARDNEESHIMSLRLETEEDHHLIGTIDVQ